MRKKKEVKKNELENKSFFNTVNSGCHKHTRILFSMVRPILLIYNRLDNWFDTWRTYLTLIGLYFFFGFILPLPILYLAMLHGAVYGYAWGGLWITICSLLAYRELNRRIKAQLGETNYYNPNATKEYIALIKKTNKEENESS